MNDVKVFYQNEDLWQISSEIYGTKEQEMTPNYYIMKLPGEKWCRVRQLHPVHAKG